MGFHIKTQRMSYSIECKYKQVNNKRIKNKHEGHEGIIAAFEILANGKQH